MLVKAGWRYGFTLLIAITSWCFGQDAQLPVDPQIAKEIAAVRAVDNHAHPVLAPPDGDTDRGFDALPVDNMEAQSDPLALRPDFPSLAPAWKALWAFDAQPPLDAQQKKELEDLRGRVRAQHGESYPSWVLDQAGIGTMLANRVAMGRGVEPPRFQWVPYADALLFPLDNQGMAAVTPDRKQFFALEDQLRMRYLKAVGLNAAPPTLDAYLRQVVTLTLERQRAAGAVAEKFEVAYLRSLDFGDPSRTEAERAYARWVGRGTPDAADYKTLQDFLFRYIAADCGRLGMAIHLHAMAGGGGYFSTSGANPMLMEPIFNDARLRGTKFVLLHGGWPFVREIASLLQKPNVYLDFSQQDLVISPRTLASWLREWLEWEPEKILFGTDAYPYSTDLGWEESAWITSRNAREALGIALSGMLADGEISRERAGAIARMVLRGNAEALYRFAPAVK